MEILVSLIFKKQQKIAIFLVRLLFRCKGRNYANDFIVFFGNLTLSGMGTESKKNAHL
jgi:hypothetical protein